MSVRLFQSVMTQMEPALCGRAAGVIDENGSIVACTDASKSERYSAKQLKLPGIILTYIPKAENLQAAQRKIKWIILYFVTVRMNVQKASSA